MQRQRADVLSLDARNAYPHPLGLDSVIDDDPERIGKEALRIEIVGQYKSVLYRTEGVDAIKRVDAQPPVAHAASHHIPPLAKDLDAIGSHLEGRCCIAPEALVDYLQCQIVAHRLDDLRQEALPRGDLLEENTPLEVVAFVDEVIHGKGVQQPRPNPSTLHILYVFDVVEIASPTVTADVDIEHLLDCVLMVVEGLQGQFLSRIV